MFFTLLRHFNVLMAPLKIARLRMNSWDLAHSFLWTSICQGMSQPEEILKANLKERDSHPCRDTYVSASLQTSGRN